jgi:hypothetical protein
VPAGTLPLVIVLALWALNFDIDSTFGHSTFGFHDGKVLVNGLPFFRFEQDAEAPEELVNRWATFQLGGRCPGARSAGGT